MSIFDIIFRHSKTAKDLSGGRKFGWKKDLHDERDFKYKVTAPIVLPPHIDLRPLCPPVYDQGGLGSCTAQALAAAFQFEDMRQGHQHFIPSKLFIYYNERSIENSINDDGGAMIRTGIKTMVDAGVCPEDMWKYDESKFKTKPCPECYTAALDNQVIEYLRLSPHCVYDTKQCLADGHPVVFGITLYESFMTDDVRNSGHVPIPLLTEAPIGGHAVMAVGYDDTKNSFIVRNSWGEGWGIGGYFYLPYWYISTPNIAADFWTIRLVE